MDLMNLANELNNEEQRYAREGFSSDEELSIYDLLFKNYLSKNDMKKDKRSGSRPFEKIKSKNRLTRPPDG